MNSVLLSSSVRVKVQKFVKDGCLPLSSRSIMGLLERKTLLEPIVVQITKLKWEALVSGTCAQAKLFDGSHLYNYFYFGDSVIDQLKSDGIAGQTTAPGEGGEILLISRVEFLKENETTGSPIFAIREYDLLAKGVPLLNGRGKEHSGTPEAIRIFRELLSDVPAENSCSIPFDLMNANSSPSISATPRSASNTPTKSAGTRSGPVTPISEVVPYGRRQRICGVCTSTDFRSTAKGGTVFSFILTDDKGKAIRVVGFNEAALKAHAVVKENQSYYVSGGRVTNAEKKFNTTGHDFEITLRPDSEITVCDDVKFTPPALTLNIIPLDKISDFEEQSVDVLAVIDVIDSVCEFTAKTGKNHTKRDLQLVDQTGDLVKFTLWEDQARAFDGNAHMAIGIKGAVVKHWNGVYSLSAVSGTKWELSPNLPQVPKLCRRFTCERNLSQTYSQASTIEGGILIRDLPTTQDSQGLNDREFKVNASITSVQHTKFQACTSEGCLEKVVAVDNVFYCQSCDRTMNTHKWRSTVTLELTDCSGSISVKAYEEIAEQIFGIYSQQRDAQNNRVAARTVEEEQNKKYIFSLYPAPISGEEETDVRYHVLNVKQVNIERYFTELEKRVEQVFS